MSYTQLPGNYYQPTAALNASAGLTSDEFISRSGYTGSDATTIRTLIDGLAADGDWSSFEALWFLCTADGTKALLDLTANHHDLTAHGSPTFTSGQGYTGAAGKWLITGVTGATGVRTQNSHHFGAWNQSNSFINGQFDMGAYDGTLTDGHNHADATSGVPTFFINGSVVNGPAQGSAGGHFVGNRSGVSATQAYKNATSQGTDTATSAAFATVPVVLMAMGFTGGTVFGERTDQFSIFHIGSSLSSAAMTRVYNRFTTARTSQGL